MSQSSPEKYEDRWCALVIGNSRLHWAIFRGDALQQTWDVAHTERSAPQQWADWVMQFPAFGSIAAAGGQWPSLWFISVVPRLTQFWLHYPQAHRLQLSDIPLGQMYSSLGCDRALAVWAAGQRYGFPVLVVDGGTALTLTGADANGNLVGGAILPGVGLQLRSLSTTTSLPTIEPFSDPPRWAKGTADAILSGVLYTLWAGISSFIDSWYQDFPDSTIVLTGGDCALLHQGLQIFPDGAVPAVPFAFRRHSVICDETLLFQGIQRLRAHRLSAE